MRPTDFALALTAFEALVDATLTGTTAVNGDDIDLQQYGEGGVIAVFNGAAGGAPTSYTVTYKLQTAPDSGGSPGTYADAVDIDGNAISTVLSANKAAGILRVDPSIQSRWVRVVATPAFTGGASPSVTGNAAALLSAAPLH